MIFTDRTIIVQKGISSINDTIILYRGDKGVEIRFTLNEGSPFRFGSGASPNIIEKTEAAYGQLVIKTPNDLPSIFSEIVPTNKGKIIFTITAEMIDEITEVGNYTFQIRLFDENRESRATLPEVENGIEIREPIATEDVSTTNEVGVATVGYAITTAATPEDAFDSQGNYNKTTWAAGDRITAAKLNKIEAGIDGVNKKANNIPTKTSQLENDSDYATTTQVNQAIDNAQLGGGEVDLSGYVTKETGNASQITFSDGQTFQAKLDGGTLKGEKGDPGEQGPQGPKGDKGADGVTTSIVVNGNTYTHVDGVITLPNYPTNVSGGEIVADGGLTSTAQTLLISILRSAVFTSDQSANIALLQSELAKGNSGGGSETTQYVITNTLNNATTSNSAVLVDANSSYTTTITINDGYTLDTITVTMDGTDITSSVVSGTTITIASVTGNVVITVTTSKASSGGGTTELPQDGLSAFFDMRNATIEKSYNQVGWGNVTKAAVSSCSEYYMFSNVGDYITNDYGIANWGIRGIRQSANTTTKLSIDKLNNSIIGLVYGKCICALYNMTTTTNIGDQILFTPKYVNQSGSTVNLPSVNVNVRNYNDLPGYSLYAITQSPTEIKLYIDGQLKHTANVSECTDFDHWVNANDDQFVGCHYYGASNYTTACAFYNKTLSDVEVVEATEYFKTLEVK